MPERLQVQESGTAAKPWIEFRRRLGPGYYRTYGHIHRRPLRVFVLGRWIWGKPR